MTKVVTLKFIDLNGFLSICVGFFFIQTPVPYSLNLIANVKFSSGDSS